MLGERGLLLRMVVALTLVYMCTAEYVHPPPCDVNNKPSVILDPNEFKGDWYRMVSFRLPAFVANQTGYRATVLPAKDKNGETTVDIMFKTSYSNHDACTTTRRTFVQDGNHFSATDIPFQFWVNFVEYDRVFGGYAEVKMADGRIFPMFCIYSRDPSAAPDVSAYADLLTQFCDPDAADLSSDFYSVKLDYGDPNQWCL